MQQQINGVQIRDGEIVNILISPTAGIVYSKLNLSNSIRNTDIYTNAGIDVTKLADGIISNTVFNYLQGVTSNIQEQIDTKTTLNPLITPGTATKVTYDTRGFIVSGTNANTDDISEGSTNLYYTDVRADARITAQKGVANGIAPLGADTKIPSAYLPNIAITNTFVVANQAAMLALTAETGDIAVRTDLNQTFILRGTDPSILADWEAILTPTGGGTVMSVNGLTGNVLLTTTEITEGTNLYYTSTRFDTAFSSKSTTDLSEGTNLYFTTTRTLSTALTGFTSGTGTIVATDTILQAIQKLDGNIGTKAASGGYSANMVVVIDGSGNITTSSNISTTELDYLNGASGTTGSGNLVFSTSPTFTTPILGNAEATTIKLGATANFTDFPNTQIISSLGDTSHTSIYNIGVLGEAIADAANTLICGIGVYGVGSTNNATRGAGLYGHGTVSNAADTAYSVGTCGHSNSTHTGGINIGLMGWATGSTVGNYALYIQSGDIKSVTSQFWELVDDAPTALVFSANGTSFLNIDTSSGFEGLSTTGYLSANNSIYVGLSGSNNGSIVLWNTSTGSTTITAPVSAVHVNFTLPDTVGTAGQVLTTDGTSGVLSWTTASGGSFSWGATASGTSGTGVGLTIGASASASTTMLSHTWDNTQANTTYAQLFNYGTSTSAKYGQYHDLTTNTGAIPMYIYYNNGTAFTSPGIFFQKAAGSTIGGSTGAIKFSTLVDINLRIGTGIYFDNLTGGTASTSSTAYAIRFANICNTTTYAYAIKATYISNGGSGGRGYFFHADTISQAVGALGYVTAVDYGSYGSSSTSYLVRVEYVGAIGASSVFYGLSINTLSSGASSTGYANRIGKLIDANTANGYGIYIDYIVGNATSGTAVGYYVNNLSLTGANNIGGYWYLSNSQPSVTTSRTGAMADMRTTRSNNSAGTTITDTFNVTEWRRYNGASNATATMNASGAIMYLENALYSSTGTLNDTVTPFRIVQHSRGSGAPIAITQNYVTSTNFRKVSTETNTGKSIWVSNGTNPNGALTGTAGDILYGGDGGKIYYCTGTTNWTLSSGIPTYPSVITNGAGTSYYSDSATIVADVSSTNLRLYSSGLNLYNSGNAQSISASSIWASAAGHNGCIILGGFVYSALRETGVSMRVYRCSITSDISVAGNWTQLTVSGTSLPFGSTDGLCGYDGTYFYFTASGVGFMRYLLSGTTLTYVDTITVTGATYTVTYDRVNSNGIYASFSASPRIRLASHAGILDNSKQSGFNLTACIATQNSFYTQISSGVYYLHNF